MSKHKKKQKKENKERSTDVTHLRSTVDRLRQENDILRSRLEKISELAGDLPVADDEDERPTRDADHETGDTPLRNSQANASV